MGRAWFLLALVWGGLRFVRLGEWSLWYDEGVTLADAYHGVGSGIFSNPLGYLAIRGTVELLGGVPDELALRLLPALVGWLTIPLVFFAFRPLAGEGRAGLAALLLAASSWHLYWSQNARFYTLAQALALAGAALWLAGLARGSAWRLATGLAVVGAGALFHPSAALVAAALLGASLFAPLLRAELGEARRLWKWIAGATAAGALVAAPWAFDALEVYWRAKGVGERDAGFELGPALRSVAHLALSTGFYVTPLLGVGILAGAASGIAGGERVPRFALLLVALAFAAALAAAFLVRATAQYVFVLLPWLCLLAAWPAGRVLGRGPRLAYAALLVLPAMADNLLYLGLRHGERPRWREAFHTVWEERGEDDLVLAMAAPIAEYYLNPGSTDLRRPEVVAWLDKWRPQVPHEWLPSGRRVWLVVSPENLEDWARADREALAAYLREECRLVARYPVWAPGRDLSVEVWLRAP